ncbi:MAG: DUF3465 domain-containing protein [Myxococcota bacterium]|nr:DUF3465 domain-containing protein [Myxococcota bacterium]
MTRRNLRLALLCIVAIGVFATREWPLEELGLPQIASDSQTLDTGGDTPDNGALLDAIRARRSGVMVDAIGEVVHLLADDLRGSRHQRFLVDVEAERAVLVSHNIDLAPRIDALRKGDFVTVRGQFEWNEKGGVVHWTHHDPDGRRPGGWIRHEGQLYR